MRRRRSVLAWLLAAAFVAVTNAALAHELKHELKQHDEIACALHLYSGHHGKAAAPCRAPLPVATSDAPATATPAGFRSATVALGYRGRAPPPASDRSL